MAEERKNQAEGGGQFDTPWHIMEMMTELALPSPEDTICDPVCGTAGFLVCAGEYLKRRYSAEGKLYGFDTDPAALRIGAENMALHGIEKPCIAYRDILSEEEPKGEKYSLILSNPLCAGRFDESAAANGAGGYELLFVAQAVRMLEEGGRCVCIVPDNVLFGMSAAHMEIRRELVENNRVEAVIPLPSAAFKPYAAILVFTKTKSTDNVWFYDMWADGFSLADRREPAEENDIPDLIERFRHREAEAERGRNEKSFLVSKAELAENGYDLSINKYQQKAYTQEELAPGGDVFDYLRGLEDELARMMEEMGGLL